MRLFGGNVRGFNNLQLGNLNRLNDSTHFWRRNFKFCLNFNIFYLLRLILIWNFIFFIFKILNRVITLRKIQIFFLRIILVYLNIKILIEFLEFFVWRCVWRILTIKFRILIFFYKFLNKTYFELFFIRNAFNLSQIFLSSSQFLQLHLRR